MNLTSYQTTPPRKIKNSHVTGKVVKPYKSKHRVVLLGNRIEHMISIFIKYPGQILLTPGRLLTIIIIIATNQVALDIILIDCP